MKNLGYITVKLYTKEKIEKLDSSLEKRRLKKQEELKKKQDKKQAELEVKQATVKSFYPHIIEYLENNNNNSFTSSLLETYKKGIPFTENQKKAIEKIMNTPKFNTGNYQEGDKISDLSVKIIRSGSFLTKYGNTYIYNMVDDNNCRFTWFTQKDLSLKECRTNINGNDYVNYENRDSDKIHIKACTVKKIDKNEQFGDSVVITRCRIK